MCLLSILKISQTKHGFRFSHCVRCDEVINEVGWLSRVEIYILYKNKVPTLS
jgi:hypothetical protein